MVKAATLYIVLIISLMIAVISVSLLSVAFYYRLEHQKKDREDRLNNNLNSGTALLLSASYSLTDTLTAKDLYGDEKDSILLTQNRWGVFKASTLQAFELRDTLKRAFLSGCTYKDSSVIYLADEDRPLSLSGTTQLTGDGELPKSGLKQSYVDGKPYAGRELIKGKIKDSKRELPALDEKWLTELLEQFKVEKAPGLQVKDSLLNTFFNPVKVYKIGLGQLSLSGMALKGRVVLVSDTTLILEQDMVIEDALIFAKAIVVKDGFKGSCQLMARDSIIIGKDCVFAYPSFAGVFKPDTSKTQSKISLGAGSHFSGLLLSYEKKRSDLQTLIALGKNSLVNGEVFATGYIQLEAPLTVQGKVTAKRFLMKRSGTLYENYLIDVVFNRKLLSKYYLNSPLMKNSGQDNQILRWLH